MSEGARAVRGGGWVRAPEQNVLFMIYFFYTGMLMHVLLEYEGQWVGRLLIKIYDIFSLLI